MGKLVFAGIFTLILSSATAALSQERPHLETQAEDQIILPDPFMIGVCEGIASLSMTVMDMQLKESLRNLLVFSITTDQAQRQDYYCFQCPTSNPQNASIVLFETNDAELACREETQP